MIFDHSDLANIRLANLNLFFVLKVHEKFCALLLSHPTRGGWIEIACKSHCFACQMSHPTRGGWIEMLKEW